MAFQAEIEDIFTYHAPTEEQIQAMQSVRTHLKAAATALQANVPECPYRTIAFRKLHEIGMIANAAIVLKGRSLR